jgi:hypothetical protein
MCKNFADDMSKVLPSLMKREELETNFSRLITHLKCCALLAQQMEMVMESMDRNLDLHRQIKEGKDEKIKYMEEIIQQMSDQLLNDRWYSEQAKSLEQMGHLRNPDKSGGDWADACSLDAAIESLRSERN